MIKKARGVFYANENIPVDTNYEGIGTQGKVMILIVDGGTEESIINNEYPERMLNLRDLGYEVLLETANVSPSSISWWM